MNQAELQTEIKNLESLLIDERSQDDVLIKAKELLNQNGNTSTDEQKIEIMLIIMQSLYNTGNTKEAQDYTKKAMLLAQQVKDSTLLAKVLNAKATFHKLNAEYVEAIENYKQSLQIHEKLGNQLGIASAYTNIGIIYRILADYSLALEFMDKGLRLYQELNNELGVNANRGNIGNVYTVMQQYDKALEYLLSALEWNEQLHNLRGVANNSLTIGGVYLYKKEYEKSEFYFKNAAALFADLGDQNGHSIALGNQAILLDLQGQYEQALSLQYSVLKRFEEADDIFGMATQYGNIANVYANKQFQGYDAFKSEEFFLKAISIFQELNLKNELSNHHLHVSNLYEGLEKWELSLIHFKKHYELQKIVLSEEAIKNAELLEQTRTIEKHEKERLLEMARYREQEQMLFNMLPSTIANRILDGESTIVDVTDDVSIFFSDIVDFTALTMELQPEVLIRDLNILFTEFDRVAKKFKVEKIKTIGDAYMAVCGVPDVERNHAQQLALFAIEIMNLSKIYKIGDKPIQLRIGLHSGKAIAGVIGENKLSYDLWGDSVNTASRMESTGVKGKIHVTEDFAIKLSSNPSFTFTKRGATEIKGKGIMQTYFLEF